MIAEKVASLKLTWDDPDGEGLRRLEALETLALGVHGKLALWRALAAIEDALPLEEKDFALLQRRAEAQHDAIEVRRVAAARPAFLGPAGAVTNPPQRLSGR